MVYPHFAWSETRVLAEDFKRMEYTKALFSKGSSPGEEEGVVG